LLTFGAKFSAAAAGAVFALVFDTGAFEAAAEGAAAVWFPFEAAAEGAAAVWFPLGAAAEGAAFGF